MTQAQWRKRTEWPLLVIAVIFLVAYSIEVIADLSGKRAETLDAIIWLTWGCFVIDYIVNLVLAENRKRWFVRNLHELIILCLPMLRPLRLLRLVTLFRFFHRFAGDALRGRIVTYVIGSAILVTYVGALAVLSAEEDAPGSNIRTFGDALWWAACTITTVGYGDHYPVTIVGRVVAVGLMVGGIAVLGVVTASVASWLVEQVGVRAAEVAEDAADDAQDAAEADAAALSAQIAQLSERVEKLSAQLSEDRA
jgi:voltage-gated potassium channel